MGKKNDQPLKDILKQMVNQYRLKPKLTEVRVREAWHQEMGVTISKYTKQLFLYKKRLTVYIHSAPLKQELTYGKENIKDILNKALGENCIEEVIIR